VYPDELKYTADHEWVSSVSDSGTVRVGITDFAAEALGEVVYVQLPEIGAEVEAHDALGELESTKSVNDVFAPVRGTVSARNDALEASPELCSTDPYGDGWILELKVSDPSVLDGLLSADEYEATVTSN
jgi:glycine cleavage system H protein